MGLSCVVIELQKSDEIENTWKTHFVYSLKETENNQDLESKQYKDIVNYINDLNARLAGHFRSMLLYYSFVLQMIIKVP